MRLSNLEVKGQILFRKNVAQIRGRNKLRLIFNSCQAAAGIPRYTFPNGLNKCFDHLQLVDFVHKTRIAISSPRCNQSAKA